VPLFKRSEKAVQPSPVAILSRNDKLLGSIRRDGIGLEIGPSFSPIAPKSAGYRVHTLDHMTRNQLIEKYRTHNVNVNAIEEVDFVWHGEPFAELTGQSKYYDWIIASHVIEHTPDFIGFLNDCDSILKDDGILSLAIPDRRYCFDYFRPISGLAKIVDAHFSRAKIHSAGTAAEYYLNVVSNRGNIAWGQEKQEPVFNFMHTADDAQAAIRKIREQQLYIDVHSWCFTPHSFRLLMHDLFTLGMSAFREVSFYPSEGCEFHVALSRSGALPALSRLQMLELIRFELAE